LAGIAQTQAGRPAIGGRHRCASRPALLVAGTFLTTKLTGWPTRWLTSIDHANAPPRLPIDALPWAPGKRSSVP
jgi:hypothetical protein